MEYLDALYKTYELKINAKNSHRENFHRWMTFYSVAIGAIIVAFYQYQKDEFLAFFLIVIGITTSFLFHMSCKGYKHWTDHWINEIWEFEEEIEKSIKTLVQDETAQKFKVYTNQPSYVKVQLHPLKSAIISTPKVTLIFSFITFCSWLCLLIWKVLSLMAFSEKSVCGKLLLVLISAIILTITYLFYFLFLSKSLYSGTYIQTSELRTISDSTKKD